MHASNPRRNHHEKAEGNIVTVVRIRPFSSNEKRLQRENIVSSLSNISLALLDPEFFLSSKKIQGLEQKEFERKFNFDQVCGEEADQAQLYDVIGKTALQKCLDGLNCTVMAYGQTGSGKSFTMLGNDLTLMESLERGIIPRLCMDLIDIIGGKYSEEEEVISSMKVISTINKKVSIKLNVSFYEIFNERVRDLLSDNPFDQSTCRVREHPDDGAYVEGVTAVKIESYEQIMSLLHTGNTVRSSAATLMNSNSSRSHAIFTVNIMQEVSPDEASPGPLTPKVLQSKLSLVDLAGSERAKQTGATGERLKEAVVSLVNSTVNNLN